MKNIRIRSIRTNIILLVLLILVPLLAILVYSSYVQKKQAEEFARQNLQRVVTNISIQQNFIESNILQTLKILSTTPEIQNPDSKKLSIFLDTVIRQNPAFASILIVNRDGNMIASNFGVSNLNVSDRKYFKDVIRNKKFSIGEYSRGRLTNKPVIHYAIPIFDIDKSVKYVLAISFDLKFYDQIFQNSYLGNSATFTFIDHTGTILYSSPEKDNHIGTKEKQNILTFVGKSNPPTFVSLGDDSIKRIYCTCSIAFPGEKPHISIIIGIPYTFAVDRFYITLTKYSLFWVIASFIIIFIAFLFSKHSILKPIDKLVDATLNIAEGNLKPALNFETSTLEIKKLFEAINEMTFKLQQRETEKNLALKDLKKLKERFELAINSAKIGIWDWHIRNNKVVWDKNMFALYEVQSTFKISQIEDWKKYIYFEDLDIFNCMLDNAIKQEIPFKGEFRILTPSNKIKIIRIYGDVILDKQYKPVRLIGVSWDISERRNMEKKMKEAKEKAEHSDKLKSAFLANISHEIRTPIHGIIGFAQIIKNEEVALQDKEQYLDIIIQNGNLLQNIISNIIDISLLETNQIKIKISEVDIAGIMNDLYTQYVQRKIDENKSFNFILEELPTQVDIFYSDELRLKQILFNLLDNAFKFTVEGEVRLGCFQKENNYTFFVKDTGIGIGSMDEINIFERFKQAEEGLDRNYKGNGLGLTICKGLVELMGGKIWLSRKQKGVNFYFQIPCLHPYSENDTLISEKSDIIFN